MHIYRDYWVTVWIHEMTFTVIAFGKINKVFFLILFISPSGPRFGEASGLLRPAPSGVSDEDSSIWHRWRHGRGSNRRSG